MEEDLSNGRRYRVPGEINTEKEIPHRNQWVEKNFAYVVMVIILPFIGLLFFMFAHLEYAAVRDYIPKNTCPSVAPPPATTILQIRAEPLPASSATLTPLKAP